MSASSQIGPYEVVRELGRGGMGVVYLAHDTRLDRDVAIKALPAELASDPARLERFEREARTLASLNHPNLAGIHGVEEQDGARYLVLEYVEGESLADRLDRGPLPADEAVELAVQIAAGLEAAHEAGVVHRDLKPANIVVTPEGQAKVLDFGLARADDGSLSSSGALDSPTMTTPQPQHSPTIEGAILGTAAYMSPEQARGRRVDKRTDIWSFGVVLYEMLVGASPFHGETATDSIGAVLHKDLDLDQLPPATPGSVRRVLERCLVRDKGQRYRDIGDVRLELLRPDATEQTASAHTPRLPLGVLALAALFLAALSAGVGWWLGPRPAPERPGVSRLSISLPKENPPFFWPDPALSADGRRLVILVEKGDDFVAVVRDMADPGVREIPGSTNIFELAISDDGRWLCYSDDDSLKKRLVAGGPAVTICDAPRMRGCVWENDESIIFAPNNYGPLFRVAVRGGEPTPLYDLEQAGGVSDRHPHMLPGGRGVLFHRGTGDNAKLEHSKLMVFAFDERAPRELGRGATHGRYVDSGHLVYQSESTLFAAGFDLETLEFTTPEAIVLEGLTTSNASAPPQWDVSPNGTLVYFTGETSPGEKRVISVDHDGEITPLSEHTGTYEEIVPSDDGRFIAVEIDVQGGDEHLCVIELGRDLLTPLPAADAGDYAPVWSPDGKWLAISSYRNEDSSARQLHRFRVGSVSPPELLLDSDRMVAPCDWSSDGGFLVVSYLTDAGEYDLGIVRLDQSGDVLSQDIEPLVDWPGYEWAAQLSPDDRWVLFAAYTELSGRQIYVVSIDDPSVSTQISVGSGTYATWAPDRDTIYYIDDDSVSKTVFAVDYQITERGELRPASPRPVLDLDTIDELGSFYTNADGTAFIVGEAVDGSTVTAPRVPNVILNWTTELSEIVPLKKQ